MRWKTLLLALAALLSIGAATAYSLPATSIDGRVAPTAAATAPSPEPVSAVAVNPPIVAQPLPGDSTPVPHSATRPEPSPYPAAAAYAARDDVPTQADLAAAATPDAQSQPTAEATPKPTPKPKPKPTPKPKPKTQPTPRTGSDHFWYPALGIAASWSWYGCGHHWGVLGGGVYRWGCSPTSNIYILSHAWSTFAAVRHGYHSGAMHVGQTVWYSGPDGKVTQWTVKWIRHVTDAYLEATHDEWATEPSPTPIMTLQTCDGRQSQYRIIVRLVPA